ncbi:MAG: LamG domain-containing protein [Deltaproteobacteria bacterium]|nr:LamG domain-containing protein [Deltaproteobacteria bacterium]
MIFAARRLEGIKNALVVAACLGGLAAACEPMDPYVAAGNGYPLLYRIENYLPLDGDRISDVYDPDIVDYIGTTEREENVDYVSGVRGNGARFNGESSFIEIDSHNGGFTEDAQWHNWIRTITFWIRLNQTGSTPVFSVGKYDSGLFIGDSNATIDDAYLSIFLDRAKSKGFYWRQRDMQILDENWHFIVLTSTEDDKNYKLYVDGISQGEAGRWHIESDAPLIEPGTLNLGRVVAGNGTYDYFKGDLDEFIIWSRPLTENEINALHNNGSPPAYPFIDNTN